MNTNHTPCDCADLISDYAFDELAATERANAEKHLSTCSDCSAEFDRLRLTTAALRVLPDVEIPQRITFVSNEAPTSGWFAGFWNSAARLGFASACVLAAGVSFAAYHRAPEVHTVIQTADVSKSSIDEAVNKAVALAVSQTHAEDVKLTQAALEAVDDKYAQKQKNLMIAVQENLDLVRKHQNTYAILSQADGLGMGVRQ